MKYLKQSLSFILPGILWIAFCFHGATSDASEATVKMHKSFPEVENCSRCHADPHSGQMTMSCNQCHNTDTWKKITTSFVHSLEFPLTGKHKQVDCTECHIDGQFKETPRDCQVCHWQRSQDDPYKTRLGIDCARCHSPKGWAPANWNHTTETGFKLSGAHRGLACDECHKDLQFKGIPARCISCHQSDFDGADDPDHSTAGFPRDCQICHTTDTWNRSSFNHNSTGFALTGGHLGVDCSECHVNGVYTGLSTDCRACHQTDYDNTRNPAHGPAGFSTNCIECHSSDTWNTGTFNHDTTGFNLTGAHTGISCADCHTANVYKGLPADCYSCHADDYSGTSDPDHSTSGFDTDCRLCHNTSSWQTGSFTHTGFELTGGHSGLNCVECHTDGRYTGTPTDCAGCHTDDYQKTDNPHHIAAGFSTDCKSCHSVDSWSNGQFTHTKAFDLTQGHSGLQCSDCHKEGVYTGRDSTCFSCHKDDYTNTDDPDHAAAGLPGDCTLCHNPSGWENDFFNHDITGYSLTGAHEILDCTDCHTNNLYKGTPRDCYSCHRDDYDDAPNHQGYPTDCQQCHNTTSWQTTRFRQPLRKQPAVQVKP